MDRQQDRIDGEPGRKPAQGGTVMMANSDTNDGDSVFTTFYTGSYSVFCRQVSDVHLGNAPPNT
jgi:hypothetical protein